MALQRIAPEWPSSWINTPDGLNYSTEMRFCPLCLNVIPSGARQHTWPFHPNATFERWWLFSFYGKNHQLPWYNSREVWETIIPALCRCCWCKPPCAALTRPPILELGVCSSDCKNNDTTAHLFTRGLCIPVPPIGYQSLNTSVYQHISSTAGSGVSKTRAMRTTTQLGFTTF